MNALFSLYENAKRERPVEFQRKLIYFVYSRLVPFPTFLCRLYIISLFRPHSDPSYVKRVNEVTTLSFRRRISLWTTCTTANRKSQRITRGHIKQRHNQLTFKWGNFDYSYL